MLRSLRPELPSSIVMTSIALGYPTRFMDTTDVERARLCRSKNAVKYQSVTAAFTAGFKQGVASDDECVRQPKGRATSKGNEAKSKMRPPSRYAHAEIRTHVIVISDPTRYQLDHGGAPLQLNKNKNATKTKKPPSAQQQTVQVPAATRPSPR
ncbi:hypothetical protein LSH36_67g02053 [Paralvinella palmiformis]|uniref:Uncharacterized protein n=1 Tax=Paralvinella palmiformis TaxID=53620 RepID=A0AAD9K5A4_9ANNE|nr:hypothetical protein LSH36_67g02053 [Paralvinella palmiformis]